MNMIGAILIALSAIFSYIIVTTEHFPSFGITLIFTTIASLVLLFKKQKRPLDIVFFGLTAASAFFVTYRSSDFLTFLNILGIMFFGSYLVLGDTLRCHLSVSHVIVLPFWVLSLVSRVANKFPFNPSVIIKKRKFEAGKLQQVGISIFISIVILIVIVPLLSSANPLFAKWIQDIAKFFDISKLFLGLFRSDFYVHSFRLIMFIVFVLYLPRLLSYVQLHEGEHKDGEHITLPLLLPKVIVSLVLLVFFVSQYQLYFANAAMLKTLNLTHSQYAREVFAQLSVVALVIFALIYTDRSRSRRSLWITSILIAQAIFLTMMAYKSVDDYSTTFGFTHKRLYGYTGVAWITGVFIMFAYTYARNIRRAALLVSIAVFTGFILVGINIANFDYLIYHVSPSRTGEGVDYQYLTYHLSPDANFYADLLKRTDSGARSATTSRDLEMNRQYATYIAYRVEYIQNKYRQFDWRTYNYSEYLEYVAVKDVLAPILRNELYNLPNPEVTSTSTPQSQ